MGSYYIFHIEHFDNGMWSVPVTHQKRSKYAHPGEFLQISRRHPVKDLFFSSNALLPFTLGIPPEWEQSQLYKWLAQFYDFERNECQISWITYENLMIDEWETEKVLMSGTTTSDKAFLFTDGVQWFPEAELLATGLMHGQVSNIRRGKITDEPINRTHGSGRYQIEELSSDYFVTVTWMETIATLMGQKVMDIFRNLRIFGRDVDLRVISTLD